METWEIMHLIVFIDNKNFWNCQLTAIFILHSYIWYMRSLWLGVLVKILKQK